MLYTYTPEEVGGTIIYDLPTGQYYSQQLHFEGNLVSIHERKDGMIVIKVFENTVTKKIISNVELEFHKHKTDNYYYPVELSKK